MIAAPHYAMRLGGAWLQSAEPNRSSAGTKASLRCDRRDEFRASVGASQESVGDPANGKMIGGPWSVTIGRAVGRSVDCDELSEQQACSIWGQPALSDCGPQQEQIWARPAAEIPASQMRRPPNAHHRIGALILVERPASIIPISIYDRCGDSALQILRSPHHTRMNYEIIVGGGVTDSEIRRGKQSAFQSKGRVKSGGPETLRALLDLLQERYF